MNANRKKARLRVERAKASLEHWDAELANSPRNYTHRDINGMLWRFDGSRPISALADKVMREFELGTLDCEQFANNNRLT